MRILVLNGSPRIHGNTAAMVSAFAEGAQENGHQVDVNKLRDKIEDDPSEPRYIQTVWGNRISVQDIRKESGYRT